MPIYNYNEDQYIKDIQRYVDNTYGEHYVAKDIQVVDIWESLGSLESTARDTAIKYLCRYGKKDGRNKKDLLKAIHYIILMMYADEEREQDEKVLNIMKDKKFVAQQETVDQLFTKYEQDIQDSYDKVNAYDTRIGK